MLSLGDSGSRKDVLAVNSLLADLEEQLKRWFKQLIIARPLDFVAYQDFEPIDDIYVTLSSISCEEAAGMISGPHRLSNSDLLKAATKVDAESRHSKEMTDLHSLLSFSENVCAKRALLFGEAGSGKSLTTLKILSEWTKTDSDSASPFTQFDLIIYVTGREKARLQTKELHSFCQLWTFGYSEEQQECILTHYQCHSEKVLFLIDAWDESSIDKNLQGDTVIMKILRGKLFCNSSVIVTSRPSQNAYPLLKECQRCYSLVGFKNNRLKELFQRRLGQEKASQLFNALSQSSHLHVKCAVQKTPLFASMLAQLYRMDKTLPTTVTALYQAMLDSMRVRYIDWVEKITADGQGELAKPRKALATSDFEQAETILSELALAGLMDGKASFTKDELRCDGRVVPELRFGLLSEFQEHNLYGTRVLYFFAISLGKSSWQHVASQLLQTALPN